MATKTMATGPWLLHRLETAYCFSKSRPRENRCDNEQFARHPSFCLSFHTIDSWVAVFEYYHFFLLSLAPSCSFQYNEAPTMRNRRRRSSALSLLKGLMSCRLAVIGREVFSGKCQCVGGYVISCEASSATFLEQSSSDPGSDFLQFLLLAHSFSCSF